MKVAAAGFLAIAMLVSGFSGAGGPHRADAAVTSLLVSQTCSAATPGLVRVSFAWEGGNPSSLQQWLDLSLHNNGWADGTYLGAGPFAGTATTFTWDNLIPGAQHYVRINQQLPTGIWDPSTAFGFSTRTDCNLALSPSGAPTGGSGATGSTGSAGNGTISVIITTGVAPGSLVPFPGGAGGGSTTPGSGCIQSTPMVCITTE